MILLCLHSNIKIVSQTVRPFPNYVYGLKNVEVDNHTSLPKK